MRPFQSGAYVAIFLTVLTVAEYIFAVNLDNAHLRFAGLTVAALAKAAFIAYYFMHIDRIWKPEAH